MNMNSTTVITGAVIAATFFALISGMTWLSIALGLLAWSLAFSGSLNPFASIEQLRRKAARQAFESLDVVGLGKRWQGKNADVALVKDLTGIRNPAPWKVQVLARTHANAWFITEMRVDGLTKVSLQQLHHINEEAAKGLLGQQPEIYEQFFGKTDTA